MRLSSKFLVFSVFLFLLLLVSVSWVGAVDEEAVILDLNSAEEALAFAYDSVFEAEKSGANVSGLLVRLNVGGDYLARAYVWYRLGVFENASHFAELCSQTVGDVEGEAVQLSVDAERVGQAEFIAKMIISTFCVVVVVVLGFIAWRVFKQYYYRRVLRLKPEVVSDES